MHAIPQSHDQWRPRHKPVNQPNGIGARNAAISHGMYRFNQLLM